MVGQIYTQVEEVLLWKNPNPTTGITSLELNIDFTPYDAVKIMTHFISGATDIAPQGFIDEFPLIYGFPVACYPFHMWCPNGYSDQTDIVQVLNGGDRLIQIASNKLTMSNGQMIYNGAYYKDWSERMIPQEIWGIIYK